MGRQICRRHLQGQPLEAHHRGGEASRRRRSELQPQIARTHRVRRDYPGTRGTHDLEFEQWANKVWSLHAAAGAEVSLADFRKDVILDFFNEAGQKALSYQIFRCWVSEYQALPELDANSTAVAIQLIVLQNEGWERDTSVPEPLEPSFNNPAD